jgi:hypothetical protein
MDGLQLPNTYSSSQRSELLIMDALAIRGVNQNVPILTRLSVQGHLSEWLIPTKRSALLGELLQLSLWP